MNTTTRRFHRTLIEAFGLDADSANPIHHYHRPTPEWVWALGFVCLMALPAAVTVFCFPNGF